MNINEDQINEIVKNILRKLVNEPTSIVVSSGSAGNATEKSENGVYSCMDSAIKAAKEAQLKLSQLSLERRKEIINSMRETVQLNAETLATLAVEETGLGRIKDKIQKNLLAALKTPGVEEISPIAYTGDNGFTLVEKAPYGVIGAITPSTNPSETVICNAIGMIAAGNSVVFNPHPSAKNVTKHTIKLLNKAIIVRIFSNIPLNKLMDSTGKPFSKIK